MGDTIILGRIPTTTGIHLDFVEKRVALCLEVVEEREELDGLSVAQPDRVPALCVRQDLHPVENRIGTLAIRHVEHIPEGHLFSVFDSRGVGGGGSAQT